MKDITLERLENYLRWRRRQVSKDAVKVDLWCLRQFMDYGVSQKWWDTNPASEIALEWLDMPGGFSAYRGILRRVMQHPKGVLSYARLPFAKDIEAYLGSLERQCYSRTQMYRALRLSLLFHEFLKRRGKESFHETTPDDVDAFIRTRPHRIDSRNAKRHIVGFLRQVLGEKEARKFISIPAVVKTKTFLTDLRREFEEFCLVHRGLREATLRGVRHWLELLETFLVRRGVRDVQDISIAHLDGLLRYKARQCQPRSLSSLQWALRHFFRYLYMTRRIQSNLSEKLVSPVRYRHDLRPKYLPWEKVLSFLASIDRSTAYGKRDYAILMLMASYGLRPREIAHLKITDVDFDKEQLRILQRKNGDDAVFPLKPEVAAALKEYLTIRPPSAYKEMFLNLKAPVCPMGSWTAVSGVAHRHLKEHFGRILPRQGAYVLRHSFAKAMLDRGAPLTDIGLVLGHRRLSTSLIYTRVDTKRLREVADNYGDLL